MTPEIRRELETQLIALRDLVEKRFLDSGNIHWKLGDTLNFIRARIISETPEADRRHLESIMPKVAVERPQKGEGEYTVSSHEGFRLFRQLLPLVPETVRRYVKSHLEAIHLMKTDRETGIKVLAKYLGQIKDREILVKTNDGTVLDTKFPRKQYPSIAGLQMALDLLAEENTKAKTAKPEDFVDVRFIKELDDRGYIDGLYKAKTK